MCAPNWTGWPKGKPLWRKPPEPDFALGAALVQAARIGPRPGCGAWRSGKKAAMHGHCHAARLFAFCYMLQGERLVAAELAGTISA
jgi:hypothetical protein